MEMKFENHKEEIIAIAVLAFLAGSFAQLAIGSGLLPNVTYQELQNMATQGGSNLQFGTSSAIVSAFGAISGAAIEDSYRLAFIFFMAVIALASYALGRSRYLDVFGSLAVSFAVTFSSMALYSFALSGLAPVIAAALMLCGLAAFELSYKRSIYISIAGAILAMAGIAAYPQMAYAGIAVSVPMLVHSYISNDRKVELDTMIPGALLFVASLIGLAAFWPFAYTGAQNFLQFLSDSRISIAIAGMSLAGAIRKFSHEYDVQNALSFLLAMIAGFFSPIAAGIAVAYCSVAGVREAQGKDRTLNDTLASLFFAAFFGAVAYSSGAGWNALLFGAMLGVAVISIVYLFKEVHMNMSAAVLSLFLAVSLLSGAYLAGSKNIGAASYQIYDFSKATQDFKSALEFVNANGQGAKVAAIENTQLASYVLGQKNVLLDTKPLATYLGSNASLSALKSAGVKYVIVSANLFANSDAIAGKGGPAVRTRAYYYVGNFSGDANSQAAAYFQATDGTVLVRPMDSTTGKLLVQDSVLYSGSQAAAQISYSELLLLNQDMPYQDASNMVVWPLSSYNTNLFKLFFGKPEGIRLAGSFGTVRVFEID